MEKMLSERGKILVILENFKFRNCGSTEKGVVYIFFVNKWFVENLLYYLVIIIAFKHCWGPPLPTTSTCILLKGLQIKGAAQSCPGIIVLPELQRFYGRAIVIITPVEMPIPDINRPLSIIIFVLYLSVYGVVLRRIYD
jgi:hypothetical protein